MPHEVDQDLISIREWLSKESYLPQDLDDFMLKKFLHSCYGSLEQTKKCIERFCVTRANMPEVYTSRDTSSDRLKHAFAITCIASYIAGEDQILVHQLDDPVLDKFDYYDVLKAFSIQADHWIKNNKFLANKHIVILDIKDYTFKLVTKVNVFFFKQFILYLLEGMPVRLNHVHVINCPSFYDKLYALVKSVLPAEVCNIITFHTDYDTFHQAVDKKYLPVEYGGEAPSMKELHRAWVKELEDERNIFIDDNMWKADLKHRKSKNNVVETQMHGSFKTLSID